MLTASGVPAVDPAAVAPVVKTTEQAVTTAKPFVEQASWVGLWSRQAGWQPGRMGFAADRRHRLAATAGGAERWVLELPTSFVDRVGGGWVVLSCDAPPHQPSVQALAPAHVVAPTDLVAPAQHGLPYARLAPPPQAITFVTTTEPLLLGEYALGLVAAWYLTPPLLKLAAGALRGYAGDVTPAAALTAVESDVRAVALRGWDAGPGWRYCACMGLWRGSGGDS